MVIGEFITMYYDWWDSIEGLIMVFMKMIDEYHNFWNGIGDPRLKGYFMMSSPLPPILSTAIYILFCTKIGPKLMENRKPFKLKNAMLTYNIFQVAISSFLFYKSCVLGWMTDYTWFCQPVDFSNSPRAIEALNMCWIYFLLKHIEFIDTIFFVLRKKNKHISTLHLFHHSYMATGVWVGVKFSPGGTYTFFGVINNFVHIVMYTYYLLAAMGPQVQKYLWWKKYLTALQIGQFVIVLLHLIPHFFLEDCEAPYYLVIPTAIGAIGFIILFSNFYRKAYTFAENKKAQQNGNVKCN